MKEEAVSEANSFGSDVLIVKSCPRRGEGWTVWGCSGVGKKKGH